MKKMTLGLACLPIIVLVTLIVIGSILFGDELTSGPSQIALLGAALVAAFIAMVRQKISWEKLEEGMADNFSKSAGVFFILLSIGALTSTWMLSGVVPTLIYYGLKMINPAIFLLVIFVFTALISLVLGSSWTTIGTIGIAMLRAGEIMGFSTGWLAGAIISGAYFGDKISPLSDTTNLAASISGVDLYKHVKYMLITNLPTVFICAIIFTVAGFMIPSSDHLDVAAECAVIEDTFNISLWLLLIPAATIFMIYKKVPAFLTLFISAILSSIIAVFVQPQIIGQITPYAVNSIETFIYAPLKMLSMPVEITAESAMLTELASTSGMAGMLNTVWLIMCVCAFGGIMEAGGFLDAITEKLIQVIKGRTSLVGTTIGTCIVSNLTMSDQYMSIIIPGKMFADIYRKEGYEPQLLSRSLEDSATVTSVLIPWNSCAAMQSSVLGVATLTYLPYCFFNILSPVVSIIVAAIGYKINRFGKPVNKKG